MSPPFLSPPRLGAQLPVLYSHARWQRVKATRGRRSWRQWSLFITHIRPSCATSLAACCLSQRKP
eukprot:748060-Pleurochrysis_carterae.AAC.1